MISCNCCVHVPKGVILQKVDVGLNLGLFMTALTNISLLCKALCTFKVASFAMFIY